VVDSVTAGIKDGALWLAIGLFITPIVLLLAKLLKPILHRTELTWQLSRGTGIVIDLATDWLVEKYPNQKWATVPDEFWDKLLKALGLPDADEIKAVLKPAIEAKLKGKGLMK